jgi:hypothetical protein
MFLILSSTPTDNPCLSTRDFSALLRYTVVSTLETCANPVVSHCNAPNKYGLSSAPCRSSQQKYLRHYAVTRIHFYTVYYPCSTSMLHKWTILFRTSSCVWLSYLTLKLGVKYIRIAARSKVRLAAYSSQLFCWLCRTDVCDKTITTKEFWFMFPNYINFPSLW